MDYKRRLELEEERLRAFEDDMTARHMERLLDPQIEVGDTVRWERGWGKVKRISTPFNPGLYMVHVICTAVTRGSGYVVGTDYAFTNTELRKV